MSLFTVFALCVMCAVVGFCICLVLVNESGKDIDRHFRSKDDDDFDKKA